MANETGPYEGGSGAGGKIRRQPAPASASARKAATPYDRPLSGRHAPAALRKASWFAKIVDPASRIIANSAVRFFSSVFKKRLPPPSSSEDDNAEVREDSIQEVHEEALENGMVAEPIAQDGDSAHGNRQKSEPELTELEQLLKSKTFSREEFNRLTELLQSRIVDSPSGLKNYEETMRGELHSRVEPNNVGNAEAQRWREERQKAREEKENAVWDNSLLGNNASLAVPPNPIPDDVGSSPADIAKAYMGVRPFRASSSALALQGKIFRDESAPNRFNGQSLVPRTEGWLGNGQLEDRFRTPQMSRARSRIQSITRTPYARNVHRQASVERVDDSFPSNTPSTRWTPIQSPVTGGRQVLKRRSSVLDDGFTSVGPMRRTRQKSAYAPLKKSDLSGSSSGQLIPLLSPGYDAGQNVLSVTRRNTEREKHNDTCSAHQARNDTTKNVGASFAYVPPQSSETARKILEHLDRMVPSPREKSAEAQLAIARNKSPSQLTVGMLNAHARRSTETINASSLFAIHDNSSSPVQTDSQLLGQGVSATDQKYIAKGKAPMFNSVAMPVEVPVPSGIGVPTFQSSDLVSVRVDANSAVSDIPSIVPEKSKGFRMSALEESDEEGHGGKEASVLGNGESGKLKSIQSDGNDGDMNLLKADTPIQTLFGSKASASTVLTTRAEANTVIPAASVASANFGSSANNISGFTFPVTPASNSLLEPPPTPTPMPSPSNTGSAQLKMGNLAPTYNFGTSTASKGPVFSFPTNGPTDVDTSKPKFDFKFESKPETSFSSTAVAAAAAATTSASNPQGTLGSESSASILKGTTSLSNSTSILSTPTAVSAPAPGIPSFGVSVCKTDGMNSPPFSLPALGSMTATTTNKNSNLGMPSFSTEGVPSASATTEHLFKSFSSVDQSTSKSGNELTSSGLSSSPSLYGIANGTSTTQSNTAMASNSANSLFLNSSGSTTGHALSSVSASSVPFAFGSSAAVSSLSSSSTATSLVSSGITVTVGSTGSSLLSGSSASFGSRSAPLFGGSTSSFGSESTPLFGGSTSSFGSESTPSFGGSSASFGSGSTPSFGGSGASFGSGSAPLFGGSSATFGSGSAPSFGGSIASLNSESAPSFVGSIASFGSGSTPLFGSGSTPSFGGSSASFGSGSITSFGGSSASFGSGSTPLLGGSSASFRSGSASSFGGSTASFGSGSAPSFSGSSASFGSGSAPLFGESSTSFGSGSTPLFGGSSASFGSGSTPSFAGSSTSFGSGSTPSFGGSSASFGSGSSPSIGGSSASFGSGSSPSLGGSGASFGLGSSPFGASSAAFGSASTPSFGLAQTFGASSATSSHTTTPSFGSGFGGNSSLPSAGFSFGGSVAANSASFQFGASGSTSSAGTFSFTASTGASPSTLNFGSKESSPASQQSMFGLTSSTPFGVPTSPAANDQMNMEDSMAEDTAQVSNPAPSLFGQSASPASPFLFGSQSNAASAVQPVFQFGAQPGVANPNPFAAGAQSTFTPTSATLEFPGGGFSLGAGGEKSGRKFIKAKRDKSRRK